MRALSVAELLTLWERGAAERSSRRGLALLSSAEPDVAVEHLARLTIGERDRRLFDLRERAFGSQMNASAACPTCAQLCECEFRVDDLRLAPDETPEPLTIHMDGFEVRFRLPNSEDLAAIDAAADEAANRQRLIMRCVRDVWHNSEAILAEALPSAIEDAVSERMGAADPQGNVQLALTCPECGTPWQAPFDIVSYFWAELQAWATRLLREIHTLASAYGWSEGQILALSPTRRQAYLELIES